MYLRGSGYSENCPERYLGLGTCTDYHRAKAKKAKNHLEPVLEEKEKGEKKNHGAPIEDNFAAASMSSRTSIFNMETAQTIEALQEGSVENKRPQKSLCLKKAFVYPQFFPPD